MNKTDCRKMANQVGRVTYDENVERLVSRKGQGFRIVIVNEIGSEMYDGDCDSIHGPLILRRVLGFGYYYKKLLREPRYISRKEAEAERWRLLSKSNKKYSTKLIMCIMIK